MVLGEDFPCLTDLVGLTSKFCAVVTLSQTKGLQPLPNADADLFGTVGKDKKVKDRDDKKSIEGKIRHKTAYPKPLTLSWS